MKQYLESFSKSKKRFSVHLPNFSKKQKFALALFFVAGLYCFVQAQFPLGVVKLAFKVKPILELIKQSGGTTATDAALVKEISASFADAFLWFDVIKNSLGYIVSEQESSISTIASVPISASSSFRHIFNGLTIFACVGCAYKIVVHFLKTERHDNISAIFGYFSFLAPLVLFMFSGQIVNQLSSINKGINVQSVTNIGVKLNNELEKEQIKDYAEFEQKVSAKLSTIDPNSPNFLEKLYVKADVYTDYMSFFLGNTLKYIYFSFFILIFTSVLAIPWI